MQRGKAIGSVVVVVVVVVDTKIARSQIIGEFASPVARVEMSEIAIARKRTYVRRSCPKGTTKAPDRAFCRTRLLVTPTLIDVLCIMST